MPNVKESAVTSVCLSDIPKSKIFEADNGKKYVTLENVITEDVRKTTFDDGNTKEDQGWVSVYQTKDEREAGEDKHYVGSVKWLNVNANSNQDNNGQLDSSKDLATMPDDADDDLPF